MKKILTLLMCSAMIFGLWQNTNLIHATDNDIIKNDSTGIPDKKLYDQVLVNGDKDGNGILTKTEIQAIEMINVFDITGTIDLTGIELMSYLKSLELSTSYQTDAKIVNLDKVLSLGHLNQLSINGFRELDTTKIFQITTLEKLDLGDNYLTNISGIEKLTKLTELDLSGNQLSHVSNLSGLVNLEKLWLRRNQLTDISATTNLTQLIYLDVCYNSLETIPNLKKLTKLDFDDVWKGSSGNLDERFMTNFSANRLTKEELINKMPDHVQNYPDWLSASTGKARVESIGVSSDKDFTVKKITSLLNDPWVKGIDINAYYHISSIPKEILDTIQKTQKYINVMNDNFDSAWLLAYDNVKDIQGDLSLDYKLESPYATTIKKATGLDKLLFISFDANETIQKTEVKLYEDYVGGYPFEYTFIDNIFENQEVYVYSYNHITGKIHKCLASITNRKDLLTVEVELTKDANTIFVSDKDGLDKVEVLPEIVVKPENNDKNIVIESQKEIPVEKIKDALNDKNIQEVTVNLSQSGTVSKDLLNEIKESQKEVTFNVLDTTNKVKYSWTFDGKNMTTLDSEKLDLNIDFKTAHQKEITKQVQQDNIFYMQFAYHGKLPASTVIKVDVSSQYKDGDLIYLYYFNEINNTIEKSSSAIKVENGYAQFKLDHCSTYFFTEQEISNPPITEDTTKIIAMIGYSVVSLLVIQFLRKKKVQKTVS